MKILAINSENPEENIKSEINFFEKVCKYYYKPKSFPTYFGHVKLETSGEKQYLLFFNYMKSSVLEFLSLKEKSKQLPKLDDLAKMFDMLINGLAFCQTLNYILKDFSFQSIFCDIDSDENFLLNFMNFIRAESFLDNNSKMRSSTNFGVKNEEILPPEMYLNFQQKFNPYKYGVFFCGCLILRLGVGHPLWDNNSSKKILADEEVFKNKFSGLFKEFETNYQTSLEDKFILLKLLNNLKAMLEFSPEKRPDFIDIFRKNINLDDMEKLKAHILVSEGLMLPLFEKYDNIMERRSQDNKNEPEVNKTFELSNGDRMVKIIGIGGIQIKKTFTDDL